MPDSLSQKQSKKQRSLMPDSLHFLLFFFLLTTLSLASSSSSVTQLHNILQAQMGSRDFANALNATIFIPSFNNGVAKSFLHPSILAYHIVPQPLTFSELQTIPLGSRIPTKPILITNISKLNFTINGVRITSPDFFINGAFTFHAIETTPESVYGILENPVTVSSPPASADPIGFHNKSDAGSLNTEVSVVFLLVCLLLWLKIDGFHVQGMIFLLVYLICWLYFNGFYPNSFMGFLGDR